MKRERVEDLGVISERLACIIDDFGPWESWVNSKHGFDQFLQYYSNEEKMHEFHRELMVVKDRIYEILNIAKGEE